MYLIYLELDWSIFKLEKCNVKLLCQVVKPSMYDDLLYPLVYMFKWFSSVLPLVLAYSGLQVLNVNALVKFVSYGILDDGKIRF